MARLGLAAIFFAVCGSSAYAQPPGRWYAAGSVSALYVNTEDVNASGTSSAGVALGVRFTPAFGVEFELDRGFGELSRVHSGKFISFARPGASREDIERLAVTMQSDTRWRPQIGWSAIAMWRSTGPGRVGTAVFAGVMGVRYDVRDTLTVVDIPAGVDRTEADLHRMMPDSQGTQTRGGVTGGLLVPIRLTRQLSVAPEVRYTYGSFGDEIYTTLRGGARLMWGF